MPNNVFNQQIGMASKIVAGLCLGLPFAQEAALAQSSSLNPCPRIYYEEPFVSTLIVPQGCPANAASQLGLPSPLSIPVTTPSTEVAAPDAAVDPIATVNLVDGQINVRLINNTNVPIRYQAIGYTEYELLQGGEETVLLNLPAPVTVALVREDEGLLEVTPVPMQEAGAIAFSLDETLDFDETQGVVRIQTDGQVFLN